MKKRYLIGAFGCIAIVGIVAAALAYRHTNEVSNTAKDFSVQLVNAGALAALPKKSASTASTKRVSNSIIPPTNSWISGAVLQATPQSVYPMPLSFLPKTNGFELGLPTVSSTKDTILGQHVPGVQAAIQEADDFMLTRFDKVSATLSYRDKTQRTIARLTVTEGSPFVYFRSDSPTTLRLTGITNVSQGSSGQYLRYTKDDHSYVVSTKNAAIVTAQDTATIKMKQDDLVSLYSLPSASTNDTLRKYSDREVTGVKTSFTNDTSNTRTSLQYDTHDHGATAFAAMSYQTADDASETLLTYDSIYGPMKVFSGSTLTTSVPLSAPNDELNLSRVSAVHMQTLQDTLKADVATTKITATDSYFAGKQLARAANLLMIAERLGDTEASDALKSILNDAFASRLDSKYWYYDTELHGIAAQTKAFGSEDFNDHHFHYGYFIYAASIMAKYDTSFLDTYKNKVDLLVADIASYESSKDFSQQRNYDAYVGHSWAAGLAPFADGNNQESSSEAMNAWNGVALWGDVTKNAALSSTGRWMLSNESNTAAKAWRSVDTSPAYLSTYNSPVSSLNFGGKRTYSTFFSDASSAKLGIQLIPMNPSMTALSGGDAVIDATITDSNYNVALGDYILMYRSIDQPDTALRLLEKQQDEFIDDGNSRTYLNAWVYAHADR